MSIYDQIVASGQNRPSVYDAYTRGKMNRQAQDINALNMKKTTMGIEQSRAQQSELESLKDLHPILSTARGMRPQAAKMFLQSNMVRSANFDEDDSQALNQIINLPDNQFKQMVNGLYDLVSQSLGIKPTKEKSYALVEIADPASPTGTRMVTRKQAVNKPGKPRSGIDIEFDAEGKVKSITTGRKKGWVSKPTQTSVEKKVLNAGDTLSQLTAIKQKFRPEYQQLGTRWSALTSRWKDKAGMDIALEDRQMLSDLAGYRAEAGQLFALTLKDLSGVAVNPTEYKRAEAWLPNPGTGLFDGDSPTELQSKVTRFEDFTRKALAKYAYINRYGLSINDVDVDNMPDLIRKRGDEIAAMLEAEGVQGDELIIRTKEILADEFGMIGY